MSLEKKLKELPNQPGVYFHKSKSGEIIYVGKAAILKNRVRQYFQNSRDMDTKTRALVAEIADTDWITVESEIDALFLESEMIKRYMPRYNILLRDDKSQLFVRINTRDPYPHIAFTRRPLDDGAEYFGPYYNGWAVRKALRYLRHIFPYSTHEHMPKRVCLQYHLGLCPGVEEQKISSADYKKTLRKLMMYLKGERVKLVKQLGLEMKTAASQHDFETAAARRNQIRDLRELQKQIVFGDREFMDISKDRALAGLQELLGLPNAPRRIEGYDISHMSGTNNVASMVVATNGLADKAQYRKFKMQIPGNNDFAHMHEVISRRFSGRHNDWPTPDLLLIDGGKGQLGAALRALKELGQAIPAIGLAKRLEEIVISKDWLEEMVSSQVLSQISSSGQTALSTTTAPPSKTSPHISTADATRPPNSSVTASLRSRGDLGVGEPIAVLPSGKVNKNASVETPSALPLQSTAIGSPTFQQLSEQREAVAGKFGGQGASEESGGVEAGPVTAGVSGNTDSSKVEKAISAREALQKRLPAHSLLTESDDFYVVLLPRDSHIVKLLQRIRDESHRFAVSYHTHLKRQRQTASDLDEIPGVGPITRKKLVQSFGSLRGVKEATRQQLESVLGPSKAAIIWQWLGANK
jgi:excinuclease ABC subunit C